MRTLWNSEDRESVLNRFDRLSPNAKPKWGKLDAPKMVTHVTDALRMGLGEVPVAAPNGPVRFWPVNVLIMFYLPWPKGAPTDPALLSRAPADWNGELGALHSAVGRFVARGEKGPWSLHVAFGRIDGDQWGRLMYRHFDHHLRQFGG